MADALWREVRKRRLLPGQVQTPTVRSPLTDVAEKEERLRIFVETLFPGRWAQLRAMTAKDVKATTVLGLELNEVSAKVRNGPPGDDEEDYGVPVWAGVIPMATVAGAPIPDSRLMPGIPAPDHVRDFLKR